MKVAVIGTGVAGLCSLRFLSEAFPDVTIDAFEATDSIGGVWVYNENIGKDKFDIPIMANLYQNLRANLPKATMELTDFPIPENYNEFMDHWEFLKYLQNYANHFNLNKYIKFRHYVQNVKKIPSGWEVEVDDLKAKTKTVGQYDYIFICSGRYHHPFVPEIKGQNIFKGEQLHSHEYRKPDNYAHKRVLFIGTGPSGVDISREISKCAEKVFLSHHMPQMISRLTHVTHKPDVQELTEEEIIFQDGTREKVDCVMYCTGYGFYFPYLDKSCGLNIERSRIRHLYNQIVNVENPSMFFIGVPVHCCAVMMRDVQARYCVALLKGMFSLPSKEKMLEFLDQKDQLRIKGNKREGFIHDLIFEEDNYYSEISKESGVKKVPSACTKIRLHIVRSDLSKFRNYQYKVLDGENFVPILKD